MRTLNVSVIAACCVAAAQLGERAVAGLLGRPHFRDMRPHPSAGRKPGPRPRRGSSPSARPWTPPGPGRSAPALAAPPGPRPSARAVAPPSGPWPLRPGLGRSARALAPPPGPGPSAPAPSPGRSAPRAAPWGTAGAVRQAAATRRLVAQRKLRRVGRPVVRAAREELGEQQREHDLARSKPRRAARRPPGQRTSSSNLAPSAFAQCCTPGRLRADTPRRVPGVRSAVTDRASGREAAAFADRGRA